MACRAGILALPKYLYPEHEVAPMSNAKQVVSRREAVAVAGTLSIAAAIGSPLISSAAAAPAAELVAPSLIPPEAKHLKALTDRLAKAPRRRDFKTVPMILTNPEQWDYEALNEILNYAPPFKQAANNVDIAGSLLNSMRSTISAEVWAFGHPDFLAVFATHGSAQLALYDQVTWDKYKLTRLAGEKFKTNTLIEDAKAASHDPADFEDPAGVYSPLNNSIPAMMRRGAVFLACHNAAWEQAGALLAAGTNPDQLTHSELAAELTNHFIPGVIVTPGMVATLSELVRVGFQYVN
jgi:hypothetical protein